MDALGLRLAFLKTNIAKELHSTRVKVHVFLFRSWIFLFLARPRWSCRTGPIFIANSALLAPPLWIDDIDHSRRCNLGLCAQPATVGI